MRGVSFRDSDKGSFLAYPIPGEWNAYLKVVTIVYWDQVKSDARKSDFIK